MYNIKTNIAVFFLAIAYSIGFVISFIRDRFFAHYFGIGDTLDIYFAAFSISDTLYFVVVSLFSLYVILPMIIKKDGKNKEVFVNNIFTLMMFTTVVLACALYFVIPYVNGFLFHSFSFENMQVLNLFSRFFLIQQFFLIISSFFTILLQSRNQFIAFAIAPILNNLGIITGTVFLYPAFGVAGLAYGVILGASLHTLTTFIFIRINKIPLPKFLFDLGVCRDCLKSILLSIPRSLTLILKNISKLLIVSIVSSAGVGSVSVLYLADNLRLVPATLIGLSYSTFLFPLLVMKHASENKEEFFQILDDGIRKMFFFLIPITVYIYMFSEPLVRFIYSTGQFTETSVSLTAQVFSILIFSTVFVALFNLLARAFYAIEKTASVFYISASFSIILIGGSYLISLNTMYDVLFSIVAFVTIIEALTVVALLSKIYSVLGKSLAPVLTSAFQHIVATIPFVILVQYITPASIFTEKLDGQGLLVLCGISLASIFIHFFFLDLFKNREYIYFKEQLLAYGKY